MKHPDMFDRGRLPLLTCIIAVLLCLAPALSSASQAQDEDFLKDVYGETSTVESPTRAPKSVDTVPENVTVITAREIERSGAHTVADVLNRVTGIVIERLSTPGGAVATRIQGGEDRYTLVVLDGVVLNNLSDDYADVGALSVENIRRIEIIKGPASSTWGSSLGGVINIITKTPGYATKPGGSADLSYGKDATSDMRAEVSGDVAGAGIYMSAVRLNSDGFYQNTNVTNTNLYLKVKKNVSGVDLTATGGLNKCDRGDGNIGGNLFGDNVTHAFATLTADIPLGENSDITAELKTISRREDHSALLVGGMKMAQNYRERTSGVALRWFKRMGTHSVVAGLDFDEGSLDRRDGSDKTGYEKKALFVNDTISLGAPTFTVGLRADHVTSGGSFLSPMVGMTYRISADTLFRAIVSRGFNAPPLSFTSGTASPSFIPNPDLAMEKVWSYQAGVETTSVPGVWVKLTLFWHDVSDAIQRALTPEGVTAVNSGKTTRKGVELEAKTVRMAGFSFNAGTIYISSSGNLYQPLLVPNYVVDFGVDYDPGSENAVKGVLAGRYIWWNAPQELGGKYSGVVVDLRLEKRLFGNEHVFASVHNIFNVTQYPDETAKNAPRWYEAGVRFAL